jgi:hypothetical protein
MDGEMPRRRAGWGDAIAVLRDELLRAHAAGGVRISSCRWTR